MALAQPALFQALIDVLVAATIDYLDRQILAGADAVQLFDSWSGVLSASEFVRWCIAPTHAIVTALRRRHPDIPVIGFARGGGTGLQRYAAETGIDAIGLDSSVAPSWAAAALPTTLCLQGNLEPLLLGIGGAAMTDAAAEILAAWASRAFVFNLGHGITPDVPVAHVEQLCAVLRAWHRAGAS
jgi:uroporphyrinogen decarboxylase